ncbi:hypothetical protein DB30_00589 [Enhygromyxa salina]|uniref:N-acetyltransferase domain-containing protein n=1 Tax=Enhygromyxa salina TaxID=215803 RepID=A0A0C2CYW2_9BACT|nr:hypothetical protein [Enhygromyxa salina]KIG13052.1 hypothetical protein DB30_00589 [Enhygromyxa salina]
MSTTLRNTTINPDALTPAAKLRLIDELHATHTKMFDGVSKRAFADHVVNSPADRTRIQIFRAGDRLVGYLAVHTFARIIAGERWVVVRGETGKLPAYRRRANGNLLISEILRACLRHPRARKAFLGCFVHPSAYVALAHVAPQIYPHWDEPTDPEIHAVMARLADEFGLEPAEAGRQGVRNVGWITRETQAERDSWARRDDPMTRLFMTQNPSYAAGHGLLVLVPLHLRNLVGGVSLHVHRELCRRLRGVRSNAQAGARKLVV